MQFVSKFGLLHKYLQRGAAKAQLPEFTIAQSPRVTTAQTPEPQWHKSQRHNGTIAQTHCGTIAAKHIGTIAKIHSGPIAKIHSGTIAQLHNNPSTQRETLALLGQSSKLSTTESSSSSRLLCPERTDDVRVGGRNVKISLCTELDPM